jgi:hypothetical protein
MENKKLIKKFSDKKKAFVAARAAQAQVEAEKGTEAAAEAATEKET